MPTLRDGTQTVPEYAVIGTCEGPRAVRHVSLLASAQSVTAGREVQVLEMGPPLRIGAAGAPPGQTLAHVVGWLDGITREERDGIREWLADLRTQNVSFSYIAHPPHQFDEVSGRVVRMRFSCAGFVERGYAIGARVILFGPSDLPEIPLDVIQSIWGEGVEHPQRRRRVGLEGDGPWRVLLPGYLLHALDRPRAELPYAPSAGNFAF